MIIFLTSNAHQCHNGRHTGNHAGIAYQGDYMRIVTRRCAIRTQFHNHLSCPYCGAIKLGDRHYDVANGRELVRATPLPRILDDVSYAHSMKITTIPGIRLAR